MDRASPTAFLAAIRHAVMELSAADFQYLGVAFVCCASGGTIEWLAMNRDGSPGTGRPDGRIRLTTGRYIDVEVSAKTGWKAKVKEDLESCDAAALKDTEELVFITRHSVDPRKADRTPEDEVELLVFADRCLGSSRPRIRFVHLDALATELIQPPFKSVRSVFFKTEEQPSPFTYVHHYLRRRAPIDDRDTWIPPAAAFDPPSARHTEGVASAQRLRAPEVLRKTLAQLLETESEITIKGRGACGKTTLALLVGREVESRFGVALYLDFSVHPFDVEALAGALSRHAPDGTVAIFDNVHVLDHQQLAELRSELRIRREEEQIGSLKVLYLSRYDLSIDLPTVSVTVDRAALENVFDYFAQRYPVSSEESKGHRARSIWCANPDVFGHDLVAFSIALTSNMHRLEHGPGDWRDVYDYVWSICFAPYPEDLRERLARLAALAQLGIFCPLTAVGLTHPDAFATPGRDCADLLKRGIVIRQEAVYERYGIYHPSFASLLWGAFTRRHAISLYDEILTAAAAAPEMIGPIVRGLVNQQKASDALAIHDKSIDRRSYETMLTSVRDRLLGNAGEFALALLSLPAPLWRWLVEIVYGSSIPDPDEVPAIRAALDPALHAARLNWLRSSPASFFLPLLRWLREDDRKQIVLELTAGNDVAVYLARGGGAAIVGLLRYVASCDDVVLRGVVDQIHSAMDSDVFAERILDRRLGGIFVLLDYLEEHEGEGTCRNVRDRIVRGLTALNLARRSENSKSLLSNSARFLARFAPRDDEASRLITTQVLRVLDASSAEALLQPPLASAILHMPLLATHAPAIADRLRRHLRSAIDGYLTALRLTDARALLTYFTPRRTIDRESDDVVTAVHRHLVEVFSGPAPPLDSVIAHLELLDDVAPSVAAEIRENLARRDFLSRERPPSFAEAVRALHYFGRIYDEASSRIASAIERVVKTTTLASNAWPSFTALANALRTLDRYAPAVAEQIREHVDDDDVRALVRASTLAESALSLRYFDERAPIDPRSVAVGQTIRSELAAVDTTGFGAGNLATAAQYLRLLDDVAPSVAGRLRSELANCDITPFVEATPFGAIVEALKYFRKQRDAESTLIAEHICDAIQSTTVSAATTREMLPALIDFTIFRFEADEPRLAHHPSAALGLSADSLDVSVDDWAWGEVLRLSTDTDAVGAHLGRSLRAIHYFRTKMTSSLPACAASLRLAKVLTVPTLAGSLIRKPDVEFIGALNAAAETSATACALELDLFNRFNDALQTDAVARDLTERIDRAIRFRTDQGKRALALANVLKRLNAATFDERLVAWIDAGGARHIEASVSSTSPLEAVRWTLQFVETYLPELFIGVVRAAFANLDSVVTRALSEGLSTTAGLLYASRGYPEFGARALLERLTTVVDFTEWFHVTAFYTVRFLLAAYYTGAEASVLAVFDSPQHWKVARYIFHHWRLRSNGLFRKIDVAAEHQERRPDPTTMPDVVIVRVVVRSSAHGHQSSD